MSKRKEFAISVATIKQDRIKLNIMAHLSVRTANSGNEALGAYIIELLKEFPDRQIASCCVSLDLDTYP